jgi:hypothetical protein
MIIVFIEKVLQSFYAYRVDKIALISFFEPITLKMLFYKAKFPQKVHLLI